jgi:hypothetical protein
VFVRQEKFEFGFRGGVFVYFFAQTKSKEGKSFYQFFDDFKEIW